MKEFLIFFVNASKNPPKGDEKSVYFTNNSIGEENIVDLRFLQFIININM